jgi:hypothetical protein
VYFVKSTNEIRMIRPLVELATVSRDVGIPLAYVAKISMYRILAYHFV